MAKETAKLSVVEIEELIAERQSQVEDLLMKRRQLQADLERIDSAILAAVNNDAAPRTRRKRLKNEVPLRTAMLGVLRKNKKGLPLNELAEQITATGYKSNSRNFQNVVYQCIYNTPEVEHDEATGKYRVAR